MTKLPGIDELTILIAKESMLPWGMAERIAEAIIRAGYRRDAIDDLSEWASIQAKAARTNSLREPSNRFFRGMAEAFEIVGIRVDRLREQTAPEPATSGENISLEEKARRGAYLLGEKD